MKNLLIQKLIDEQVIDFDKMIKKTYKHIGLKEVEAIFLMALFSLKQKGVTSINPSIISSHLSLNVEEATILLDSMMQREYLSFDIKENKDGKTTESFSLDQTIAKVINFYQEQIESDILSTENSSDTDESEIAEILETQFQRQLNMNEVQVIVDWIHKYNYTKDEIKSGIVDAVKSGKTSMSYIDSIILKNSKRKDEKVTKTNRKKSKILKDFLES